MSHRIFPLLLLSIALFLSGCARQVQAQENIGDPVRGQIIYETGGDVGIPCASCHSLDGSRIVGPSFQRLPERAGTRVEGLSAEAYIRQSILAPGVVVVDGYENVMPVAFGETFDEQTVNDLIAFLLTQTDQ
jgi:cytochrome c551/c552